jgi:hypothetical protein
MTNDSNLIQFTENYCFILKDNDLRARSWWLMPVILDTQETAIRRITVRSQPQAINSERPYLENT